MPAKSIAGFEPIDEHAVWLNKTARTLLRWCDQPGGLPYTRAGRTRLFNRAWTLQWIEAQRVDPNPTRRRRAA